MNENRFGQILGQLFQPLQAYLSPPQDLVKMPVEMGMENLAEQVQTRQQIDQWKNHIQARLQRQTQAHAYTDKSKGNPVNQAPRAAKRYAFNELTAHASLDLLFPENRSTDLSKDPALASARVSQNLTQLNTEASENHSGTTHTKYAVGMGSKMWEQTGDISELDYQAPLHELPLLSSLLEEEAENYDMAFPLEKQSGIKSGFVSTPQAQPLVSLADALAAMSQESIIEIPCEQEPDEVRFFEVLPLDQTVNRDNCYDTFQDVTQANETEFLEAEPSQDEPEEHESKEAEQAVTSESLTKDELLKFQPYEEAFSMDHLIRRNRFLSNSINHLASQYFKNSDV